MNRQDPVEKDRKQYAMNMALAVVTGLVGLITSVIVLASVFLGLWLDNHFQTRPMITIILVVASIPVSVFSMLIVVRKAVSRIKVQTPTKKEIPANSKEESDFGKSEYS